MAQIDPAAEVRQMYLNYSNAGANIYDLVAPTGATTPYCVIRVDAIPVPIRDGEPEYRAIVNLDIFDEYREYGGSMTVDGVSSAVLTNMVPIDQRNLPPLTNFSHVLSKLIRATPLDEYVGSVQVFGRRLTIEHFLKLPQ